MVRIWATSITATCTSRSPLFHRWQALQQSLKTSFWLWQGVLVCWEDFSEYTQRCFCQLQEPVLFAESIFYNIAFGLRRGEEDASLAEVQLPCSTIMVLVHALPAWLLSRRRVPSNLTLSVLCIMGHRHWDQSPTLQVEGAAKLANAHSFILSFPMGYRTLVGERGALSLGHASAPPEEDSAGLTIFLRSTIVFWFAWHAHQKKTHSLRLLSDDFLPRASFVQGRNLSVCCEHPIGFDAGSHNLLVPKQHPCAQGCGWVVVKSNALQ